jgi:hypothetical protein
MYVAAGVDTQFWAAVQTFCCRFDVADAMAVTAADILTAN